MNPRLFIEVLPKNIMPTTTQTYLSIFFTDNSLYYKSKKLIGVISICQIT